MNGIRAPSRDAPDVINGDHLFVEKRTAADQPSPSRWAAVAVAIAIISFCGSIYCAVGFEHYKHLADAERTAAQRTERANADLHVALDQLRDKLAAGGARIGTTAEIKPAATQEDRTSPVSRLIQGLRSPDSRAADMQLIAISAGPPNRPLPLAAAGRLEQIWTGITLDQRQGKIEQLGSEYAEIVGERDQLRQRVAELEQQLALLETRQAPAQAANAPQNSTSGTSAGRLGATSIAFPGSAAGVGAERPAPVLKNFTAPGSAPNYFTNESGAILGNPGPAPDRQQR